MSDITALAGRVAGFLVFASYVPFILAILSKKVSPSRVTWFIWFGVNGLIASSSYALGARETIWVALGDGLGSLAIGMLALKYGEGGWTRLDRRCLVGVGLSALLWWWFNSPLIALCANIAIDLIGIILNARKSHHKPDGKELIAWGLFFLGSAANMFAINRWTFAIALYPISQIVGIGLIAVIVFRSKRNSD